MSSCVEARFDTNNVSVAVLQAAKYGMNGVSTACVQLGGVHNVGSELSVGVTREKYVENHGAVFSRQACRTRIARETREGKFAINARMFAYTLEPL